MCQSITRSLEKSSGSSIAIKADLHQLKVNLIEVWRMFADHWLMHLNCPSQAAQVLLIMIWKFALIKHLSWKSCPSAANVVIEWHGGKHMNDTHLCRLQLSLITNQWYLYKAVHWIALMNYIQWASRRNQGCWFTLMQLTTLRYP